jgi:hypothetical protein
MTLPMVATQTLLMVVLIMVVLILRPGAAGDRPGAMKALPAPLLLPGHHHYRL